MCNNYFSDCNQTYLFRVRTLFFFWRLWYIFYHYLKLFILMSLHTFVVLSGLPSELTISMLYVKFVSLMLMSLYLLSVIQTIAIDKLNRSIIIWKTPRLQRIIRRKRLDPMSGGFFISTFPRRNHKII